MKRPTSKLGCFSITCDVCKKQRHHSECWHLRKGKLVTMWYCGRDCLLKDLNAIDDDYGGVIL